MSKLSQICGRSKIFTIEGVALEFKSNYITIDEFPALMVAADPNIDQIKKAEVIKDLVIKTMKKVVSDATEEEIKEFALRNLQSIMNAIVEMSGLKNESPTE
jgi:hypothetical protein